ncbi:hypothetical protein BDK51DRAFT_37107 [Blyttiomyces helicus]|uniref:Uncharacterized protein n=1 Tax=Blyttiomyces helicus TaxID=388810 RepID=A0A4P9W6S5_9FUNG|nr:hypothetical protein BDK51DRAFT_37107 [Blyttiomyces helicus]|eukprot:RKO88169.1 hypothetical protein BDK51DRAFT_37107 [Blyttiomyces helicus]
MFPNPASPSEQPFEPPEEGRKSSGAGGGRSRPLPRLLTEVQCLEALKQSTRTISEAFTQTLLLVCYRVSKACNLPLLALARLTSDALMRELDRRQPPIRRLYLEAVGMPSIPVLRLALPMPMNLHVLELSTNNYSFGHVEELGSVALILRACDRFLAFILQHDEYLRQLRKASAEVELEERLPVIFPTLDAQVLEILECARQDQRTRQETNLKRTRVLMRLSMTAFSVDQAFYQPPRKHAKERIKIGPAMPQAHACRSITSIHQFQCTF